MIGIEDTVKIFPMNWAVGMTAAKPCDSCKSAASILYCRADSAYLCMSCDSKIHGANKLASRHERVWVCEICEQAPAAVTCKADAATLCVTCDADIHSANPLARRHIRVPVQPFFDSAAGATAITPNGIANEFSCSSATVNFLVPSSDEVEAASWILPYSDVQAHETTTVLKNEDDVFFSDLDHLLEFNYHNSIDSNPKHHHHHHQYNHGADSVVPVQQIFNNNNMNTKKNQRNETSFDIDFCNSKLTPFNFTTTVNTQSTSQSISSTSSLLDVGIVPDGNGSSETSFSFGKQSTISISNNNNNNNNVAGVVESQLFGGVDREARVLRYREKRRNRKFEKTIRYASRKAYAETRPRIKGRFAKRSETEPEEIDVDGLFVPVVGFATFMTDSGYGVVPSF